MFRNSPALMAVLPLLLFGSACHSQNNPPPPPPPPQPGQEPVDWAKVAVNLRDEYVAAVETHAGAPADVKDSNLPLVALEIEKIQLRLSATWRDAAWTAQQEQSLTAAQAALKRLADGQTALTGQTGAELPEGYLTRAYLDRSDGSPQPYHVRLPADYDATRKWPVVVFLHGYVPETSKADPWVLPPTQWQMAADRGLILCLPHGRRNTDFLGIGEVDVLRVIEELQRFYSVDPDRVLLTGCSMGGYGGWAIGLRQPDRFAALSLMSGQTDFFTWENRDRAAVKFKSWCILQNNPLDLAPNARHLPMQLQHGEKDPLVPVVHSRLIVPVMKELGYPLEYTELADAGHFIYWEDEPFRKMFDWCRDKVRVKHPREVVFRTYTPKQGRAYWVDVRRLAQWGPPAVVEAKIDGRTLTMKTDNVADLWLDLPAELAGHGLSLQLNGQPAGTVAAGPHQVTIRDGQPSEARPGTPPAHRPRVGPAREVFNDPFLLIYATGGTPTQQARNKASAERFRRIWYSFSEAVVPLQTDTALTAEQVASHNLVIFGEPDAVTLAGLADPTSAVPTGVVMQAGRYTVGEQTYTGDNLGMVLLTPHPLSDQRLLLWWSGQPYGAGLPVNHQFDLLPDVLVYNEQQDTDATNQFLVGGFFDQDWRLDESLLDRAAPR